MNQIPINKKHWLIKSHEKILGPFDLEDIKKLLRDREISIFDEIKSPIRRWIYLREHPLFSEIVNQLNTIQQSHHDNEEGKSQTHTLSQTQTSTQTQTQTDSIIEPLIEDGTSTVFSQSEPQQTTSEGSHYVFYKDPKIQMKIKQGTHFQRLVFYVVEILVVLFILYLYLKPFPYYQQLFGKLRIINKSDPSVQEDSEKKIYQYLKKNQIEQAIAWFQNHKDWPYSPLFKLDFLPWMIFENLHEDIPLFFQDPKLPKINSDGYSKDYIQALFNLSRGEYQLSQKIFQINIDKSEHLLESTINLITAHLLSGNETWINQMLEKHFETLQKSPFGILILSQIIVNKFRQEKKTSTTNNSDKNALKLWLTMQKKPNVNQLYLFDDEMFILSILARMEYQTAEEVSSFIFQGLDRYPTSWMNWRISPYISNSFLRWSQFKPFCDDLIQKLGQRNESHYFRSFCFYKQGQYYQALEEVELLRKKEPITHPWIAWHSFLLKVMKRTTEAKALLLLPDLDKYLLPQILKGEFCDIEKNYNCSEKIWEYLLKSGPDAIRPKAYIALADSAKERKHPNQEFELIQKGISRFPNYIAFYTRPKIQDEEEKNGYDTN